MSNTGGTTAYSTSTETATLMVNAASGGPISDDFSSGQLDPLWNFVDPQGDATATITGVGTSDAILEISIPGGIDHDPWMGANMAPRVMQPVANTDFEVEVKTESSISAAFQVQGIIVEEDATNFLRFDFYSNGANVKIFAASISNGAPTVRLNSVVSVTQPVFMRVSRTGDNWEFSYYDGTEWTIAVSFVHQLQVTRVGPFAGNAGGATAPAHTAKFDYFFDETSQNSVLFKCKLMVGGSGFCLHPAAFQAGQPRLPG